MVRKQALILMLLGFIVLTSLFLLEKPVEVSNEHDLEGLIDNTKVYTSGVIIDINQYGSSYIIKLDNNLSAIVDSPVSLKEEVSIDGVKEEYRNTSRIQTISIVEHDS